MTLNQSEFPQTTALADSLAGSGQINFSCLLAATHVDKDLKEGSVAVRFDGEYQATLQMIFTVALGSGAKQRNSQFVYEHDLKRVNFRSSSVGRTGRGYTSTMANDYVLYVRNALGEFDKFNGLSLNNNERGLAVLQPEVGKKGRLFFGTARPTDSQQEKKYVFINIDKSLEALIPPPPPVTGISWSDMQSQMPIFAGKIQAVIDEAKSKSQGQINFYPDRIKAELSVEYKPIVKENNIWWQSLWNKIKEVFNSFIAKVTGKQKNVDKGIGLLGENNNDFSICNLIDGNLRQRFWQTATFKLDFSQLTDNSQVNDLIVQKMKEQGTKTTIDVQYFTPDEISQMPGEQKEFCTMITDQEQKQNTIFTSRANEMYAFKPNQSFSDRHPTGTFPSMRNWAGSSDYTQFLPYASYLLRSYMFTTGADFMKSSLVERDSSGIPKKIHLRGIIGIASGTVKIPDGMQYTGKGAILSCSRLSPAIELEGSFTRADPDKDWCVLYSWNNDIKVNSQKEGKIEASLIALHLAYNGTTESSMAKVDFSNRKVEVFGNLVADRLNLETMGKNQPNTLIYNPAQLYGDKDEYLVFLGGRLRRSVSIYDKAPTP